MKECTFCATTRPRDRAIMQDAHRRNKDPFQKPEIAGGPQQIDERSPIGYRVEN
jgi:hypothetical protein